MIKIVVVENPDDLLTGSTVRVVPVESDSDPAKILEATFPGKSIARDDENASVHTYADFRGLGLRDLSGLVGPLGWRVGSK